MSLEPLSAQETPIVELAAQIGQAIANGNLEEAYESAASLSAACPTSPAAQSSAGVLAARVSRLDDAARHFSAAVRLIPDDYDANYNLALVDLGADRWEQALARLKYLRHLHPENADLLNDIGVVWQEHDRPLRALAAYSLSLRADPNNSLARNNAMQLCLERGWVEWSNKIRGRQIADDRLNPISQAEIERWTWIFNQPTRNERQEL